MNGFGGKWTKSQKGLTLLELTVALALFGILALVSLNLLYYELRTSKVIEDKVEIINNMNYALGIISKAIRETNNASAITIEGNSTFETLNLPGNLSFKVDNGVIQKIDNGTTLDLTTKGKMEVIKLNFDFNPDNPNSIKIELTVKSRDGQTVESSLEAAVRSDV